MQQRRFGLRRAALVLTSLVAVSGPVMMYPISNAFAVDLMNCRENVSAFFVSAEGDIEADAHEDPETGAESWVGRQRVGQGWSDQIVAGPDGRVYEIRPNGEVHRYHWLGDRWENNGESVKIASDWFGWSVEEMRNRIAVDANGDFYQVHDNVLVWLHYDEAAKTWNERVVDTGWETKYDLIVAAGEGVLYARTPSGDLYRYQYHAASQRWLEYGKKVGSGGWDDYSVVSSPGGDVLYGVSKSTGSMKWYRYLGNGKWADGPTVVAEEVPATTDVAFSSDGCKLQNPGLPQRPSAPVHENSASIVIEGEAGKYQHFYVDSWGRLIQGRQRSDDPLTVEFAPIAGYQEYADTPSAVRTGDNTFHVVALGQDGESRLGTRAAGVTTWPSATGFGGWTPGPASLVLRDNVAYAFAVDAAGKLWTRAQDPTTKAFTAWRVLSSSGLSSDLTVVAQPDGIDVLARTTAGLYTKATFANGKLGAWTTLPGTGWAKKAAAVANPDKNLQVFATLADGTVVTIRESNTGFPAAWTPIAGLSSTGVPAVATDAGVIRVAARSTDGYVYSTEQLAPGATSYRAWARVVDRRTGASYAAATDPAMGSRAAGGSIVTYRDVEDVSYIFTSVPAGSVAARSAEAGRTEFTGGAVPKPTR